MVPKVKVNLTLVKRFIDELEKALDAAELIKESAGAVFDNDFEVRRLASVSDDYILAMYKASGFASGAADEAKLLMTDIHALIKAQSMLAATAALESYLDSEKKAMGGKGSGGSKPGAN